jgi:hypothetical protein
MKVTRFLVSLLMLGAVATTASAQGVASLNWNSCVGPLNRTITPDGLNGLYASVSGHSAAHKAYQVFVFFGSGAAGPIRDAWRFDAPGCQGSSFLTIDHLAPAAVVKTCPSFQGTLQSLQIKDYSVDAVTGKARGVLANSYPAGIASTNPATRYFLARFLFDHTFSVNGATTPGADCGGLEVAVCAHFTSSAWLDLDGIEFEWAKNSEWATANDPNNDSRCPGATPAENTSWGAIKAQYKR